MDSSSQLAHSQDVATKVALLFRKRMELAQQHYTARVEQAYKTHAAAATPAQPMDAWTSMYRYSVDFAQRSVLFWDTLRQPANPTYSNESNLHMALAIMAVGDGYAADTPQVIATLSALQDWWLYPVLHRVLHPVSYTHLTLPTNREV